MSAIEPEVTFGDDDSSAEEPGPSSDTEIGNLEPLPEPRKFTMTTKELHGDSSVLLLPLSQNRRSWAFTPRANTSRNNRLVT